MFLDNTQVTDAELKLLPALKHLQTLDLSNTQVTDAGSAKLSRALPRCQISK